MLVAAVCLVKFYIAPRYAWRQIHAQVSQQWDGAVRAGSVSVSWLGEVNLREFELVDQQGRRWLLVHRVELDLENILSGSPVVTGITAQGPQVDYYAADAGTSPLRQPSAEAGQEAAQEPPRIDLRTLKMNGLSAVLHRTEGPSLLLAGVDLAVRKEQAAYLIDVSRGLVNSQADQPILSGVRLTARYQSNRLNVDNLHVVVQGLDIDCPHVEADRSGFALTSLALTRGEDFAFRFKQLNLATAGESWSQPQVRQVRGSGLDIHVGRRLLLPAPARQDADGAQAAYAAASKIDFSLAQLQSVFDPHSLDLSGVSVTLEAVRGPYKDVQAITDLDLQAVRQDRQLLLTLAQAGRPEADLHGSGYLGLDDLSLELSLEGNYQATPRHVQACTRMFSTPWLRSAQGNCRVNLRIDGRLGDANSLIPTGEVLLNGWTARGGTASRLENINARLVLGESIVNLKVTQANAFGGKASGSIGFPLGREQEHAPAALAGELGLSGVSLSELSEEFFPQQKINQGTLDAKGNFSFLAGDWDTLRSGGLVQLTDANLINLPVVPQVYDVLGLLSGQNLSMTDVAGVIEMAGPEVTVIRGELTNPLAAVEVERDGKVNLRTQEVDLYVTAVPLRRLKGLLLNVPLSNLLVDFHDRLIRLHVKGKWTDPPARLIRKEPLKDVSQAALDFFRQAANTGGNLPQHILRSFQDTFRRLNLGG